MIVSSFDNGIPGVLLTSGNKETKTDVSPPTPNKLKVLQYPRVQLQNLAGNQFSTTLATSCSVEHSAPSALVCQKISEENIDKV